jgi:catechol 2,3-dioxygenase-like lactoylglutathione lyase family enzyme
MSGKTVKGLFRVECVNPVLNAKDISASRQFYVGLLGFTEADWGHDDFTCVINGKSSIYLCKEGQGQPGTWIWMGIDGDLYELHQALLRANAKVLLPPTNFSWALEMQIEDPDGHVLRIGTDPDNNKPFEDIKDNKKFD